MNTAIVLVAFGSTVPSARASYARIQARMQARFPKAWLTWVYSSNWVRQRLQDEGEPAMPLAETLAAIAGGDADGQPWVPDRLIVQSLHVIAGAEFADVQETVHRHVEHHPDGPTCEVALPLLASPQDLQQVTDALVRLLPADRSPDDAVVFMGHGSRTHPGHLAYLALAAELKQRDSRLVMATLDNDPTVTTAIAECQRLKVRHVYLFPFVVVAGRHVRDDMAGDDADSWKSQFEAVGIPCTPSLAGCAEHDELVDIWIAHTERVMG